MKNKIKILDYYYVETRYPNSLGDVIPAEFFNKADAQEAIKMASLLIDMVRSRLNKILEK